MPMTKTLVRSYAEEVAWVFAGAFALAVLSKVAVPLPFTPVPITGQTFGVLFLGAALGARRGFLSALVYLALGSLGLPAFWGSLHGPTGGYLLAFPLAAGLVGWASERSKAFGWLLGWMLAANALIYALGAFWLSLWVKNPIATGVLPFIPGDALKAVLAASLASRNRMV